MPHGTVREWLAKISEAGVRRRAEHYYQQLDVLRPLHPGSPPRFVGGSQETQAVETAAPDSGDRPDPGRHRDRGDADAAPLPHQATHLWTYSGLALETHDSAQYRVAEGQLQRSKKPATVRGLNKEYNHDLKDIFKGAAIESQHRCWTNLHDFYEALLAKGRKPTMARLTLARKIAAITLIVWKKEVRFDANYLKPQAA